MALYSNTAGLRLGQEVINKIKYPYLAETAYTCRSCRNKLYATYETKSCRFPSRGFEGAREHELSSSKYFSVLFKNFKCINTECTLFALVIDYLAPKESELDKAENFYLGIPIQVKPNSVYYDSKGQKQSLTSNEIYFHWENSFGRQESHLLGLIKLLPDIKVPTFLTECGPDFRAHADWHKKRKQGRKTPGEDHGLLVSLSYDEPQTIIVPIDMLDSRRSLPQ
jgi:hypothetical protein